LECCIEARFRKIATTERSLQRRGRKISPPSSGQRNKPQIAVEEDSAQMVSDIIRVLKSLMVSKKDKSELEDAIEHMEKIQRGTVLSVRDIQRNIDDIMEALDSLLSITSADISEIRLMVDTLLEVLIGRLILFPSS
jgi:hypothetical protein